MNEDLLNAIRTNDLKTAIKIIPEIKEINVKDSTGLSYLTHAVKNNRLEIAKALLNHPEIDMNIRGYDNYTPIHYCASNNSPEMLKLLIEKGGDIYAQDVQGNTPLSIAVMRYRGDDSVVKILLNNGADPNTPNRHGITLYKILSMPKNKDLIPLFPEPKL